MHCQVCLNLKETETFTSASTIQTYKIIYDFICHKNSLIDLLTCTMCRKQHVGLTVDIFWSRWNNYKGNDRKYLVGDPCLQEHIYEHFNRDGHTAFLENASLTFTEKTKSWKKNYWIDTLKNIVPLGLTLKQLGGNMTPAVVFRKISFLKRRWQPHFCVF